MDEQNNNNQVKQNTQLMDLEPVGEVKGGSTALPSVTDLVLDPFNSDRLLMGGRHPGGVNVCLADGSVR